jgi:hypothetical protein
VIASGRPCPPIPPLNLHGKEGVDGSSPSEGFLKKACKTLSVIVPFWPHSAATAVLMSWEQIYRALPLASPSRNAIHAGGGADRGRAQVEYGGGPFRAGLPCFAPSLTPTAFALQNACVNRSVADVEFPCSCHAAWTSARCTPDRHRVLGVGAAGVRERAPEARLA